MEKILAQILDRLTSVDGNIASLQGDVATLKGDVVTLKGDVATLKSDMATLKGDVAVIKNDMLKFERKLDAVYEQTAELVEFKTEVTEKLDQIIEDNKSLQEIMGEHEIAIRSMRRKSISCR